VALALAFPAAAGESQLVVIVHPSNPLAREISVHELRLVYALYQRAWKGGSRVELVLPPSGSDAMEYLLENVLLKSNPSELARYYIQAVFQNRIVEVPPVLDAVDAVAYVRGAPGGIAVLRRAEAGAADGVRVLEIRE
jgi:ABC-type phosphate transport system substrate-binding protein